MHSTVSPRQPRQGTAETLRGLSLRAARYLGFVCATILFPGMLASAVASNNGLQVSPGTDAPQASRRLIHTEPSDFATVLVYETGAQRCMTFNWLDNPNSESCYAPSHPDRMVFDYTRTMMAALYLQPAPARVLVIGLGGRTLPSALAALLPDTKFDCVEIDPAVVRVAQAYFGFTPGTRQRVHLQDGRAFVADAVKRGDRYDIVMLDAFEATYIPSQLMTIEFLQILRNALSDHGVVVANTATASPLYDRETATYTAVFGDVYQVKDNNRVIFATPTALPAVAHMKENADQWQSALEPYEIEAHPFFSALTRVHACDAPTRLPPRPACVSEPLRDAAILHSP